LAQFLSEDFMTAATATLADHAGFAGAIANVALDLQFVVTDAPEGEVPYYLNVADGAGTMARGQLDEPDVTVTTNYETMEAISKGELNTQMAFMTGKLKVGGNMAKLMMNQAVVNQFATALSGMDVQY
jgi:putative sterol carrier protein